MVIPSDRGGNQLKSGKKKKQKKKTSPNPAQGHRAHEWQTWVLNPKTTLLPYSATPLPIAGAISGKDQEEEPVVAAIAGLEATDR